jgi:hypothetical protein
MLAPEKWNEKIRSAAAISVVRGEDLLSASKPGTANKTNAAKDSNSAQGVGREDHWITRVKEKAEKAVLAAAREGERQARQLYTKALARSPSPTRGTRGAQSVNDDSKSLGSRAGALNRLEQLQKEREEQIRAEALAKKEARRKMREEMPAKPVKPELNSAEQLLLSKIMGGDVGQVCLIVVGWLIYMI